MKKFKLLAISSIFLSSLMAVTSVQAKTKVSIGFHATPDRVNPFYFKSEPTSCLYAEGWKYYNAGGAGGNCRFENISDLPEIITVKYTKWLPYQEMEKKYYGVKTYIKGSLDDIYYNPEGKEVTKEQFDIEGRERFTKALDALPQSAWQTYTFYPKQIAEKYKHKNPEGKPMGLAIPIGIGGIGFPSVIPSAKPKVLDITITMFTDGTISQSEKFYWENGYTPNLYTP